VIGTGTFFSKDKQLMILLGVLVSGVSIALLFSRVLPPSVQLSRPAVLALAQSARQPGAALRPAF
jgi:hypothetical protein